MNYTNEDGFLVIPESVYNRDGPFDEFKQDASIISVETIDGRTFSGILVLHPNYIIAMQGQKMIPFDPSTIIIAFQTDEDKKTRSRSDWTFWKHPWSRD